MDTCRFGSELSGHLFVRNEWHLPPGHEIISTYTTVSAGRGLNHRETLRDQGLQSGIYLAKHRIPKLEYPERADACLL